MHALFDDAGKFLAGRILSEAESSAQIELDSGKRVKVKAANILLKFDKPAPAELLAQARETAASIELPLAWEFAPEDEFGFADLAREYFSANAPVAEQAGMLLALYEAPHYFRRAGKGRFRKAPAEILQQAQALHRVHHRHHPARGEHHLLRRDRCDQRVMDRHQLGVGIPRPQHGVVRGFLDVHVLEVVRHEQRQLLFDAPRRAGEPRHPRRVAHPNYCQSRFKCISCNEWFKQNTTRAKFRIISVRFQVHIHSCPGHLDPYNG